MKKKGGSRSVLLLAVFLALSALLAWWFRGELERWLGRSAREGSSKATNGRGQERIKDEERKKLDEVLKRR